MTGSNKRQLRFPAVLYRGGTSKGLFFTAGVLPDNPQERDRVLLRAVGGGDRFGSEIDGVGGATSSTSKAVVVSASKRPGCDLDYLFAQVSVREEVVDWGGSCGNLAAAVGPFAIDEGIVPARKDLTTLRIWQANTAKEIVTHVTTRDGRVVTEGEFLLAGVPHASAPIRLDFMDPTGSVTGKLFPTGAPLDELEVGGRRVQVTIVDAANPCAFVRSADVGLSGLEPPAELNSDSETLERLEHLRAEAAVAMGMASDAEEATKRLPALPRIGVVTSPSTYVTSAGEIVGPGDVDIVVRMLSMGRAHHAVPATGGTALAVAARITGTVPNEIVGGSGRGCVRIGHPSGSISFEATVVREGASWAVPRVTVLRSARRLMEGNVLVPPCDQGAPDSPRQAQRGTTQTGSVGSASRSTCE